MAGDTPKAETCTRVVSPSKVTGACMLVAASVSRMADSEF